MHLACEGMETLSGHVPLAGRTERSRFARYIIGSALSAVWCGRSAQAHGKLPFKSSFRSPSGQARERASRSRASSASSPGPASPVRADKCSRLLSTTNSMLKVRTTHAYMRALDFFRLAPSAGARRLDATPGRRWKPPSHVLQRAKCNRTQTLIESPVGTRASTPTVPRRSVAHDHAPAILSPWLVVRRLQRLARQDRRPEEARYVSTSHPANANANAHA